MHEDGTSHNFARSSLNVLVLAALIENLKLAQRKDGIFPVLWERLGYDYLPYSLQFERLEATDSQ